jgi:ribosomal protein L29
MIASFRAGPIVPLTAPGRLGRDRLVLVAIEVIGAIPRRRLLALSTEELILELAILAAKLFDFRFKLSRAIHRPRMHRLPVPDFLAEVEVLATKIDDFLAELVNLAVEVSHQLGQISQFDGRR